MRSFDRLAPRLAPVLLLSLAAGCGHAPPPARANEVVSVPPGDVWVDHLRNDLAPFWAMPAALGSPRGAFPTFRCDDGSAWDAEKPCPELAKAPEWIRSELTREYTRMRSRQTYFYGVAYHLTGEERYLELARDGVSWIRANAFDRETGSAITYWDRGQPGPPPGERTSQDLAYAALGPAFYAYLTRDPDVLADVLRLKAHVFSAYDDPALGMLRWAREDPKGVEDRRQELVSQLDQVNAYLLLLTPILPEPEARRARADLSRVCRVIVERFYSPEHGMFWGSLHDPADRVLGSRHTDFGHSIKAFWMLERSGRLLDDPALVAFARRGGSELLKKAFVPSTGCWATGFRQDGSLDAGLTWWAFAELDQMAATLALTDREEARVLSRTAACWREHLVDPVHHEVWAFADPTRPGRHFAKTNQWKNGYHSAEHALVSYLTAQQLGGRPAVLHFAFEADPPRPSPRPYLFDGDVAAIRETPLPGFPGRRKVTVSFTGIR